MTKEELKPILDAHGKLVHVFLRQNGERGTSDNAQREVPQGSSTWIPRCAGDCRATQL